MRWMIFFAVLVVGCAATMPDDPMLTGDLAWGVAGVIAATPANEPMPPRREVRVEQDVTSIATKDGVPADAALLVVEVPEPATVEINGHQTTSTGRVRQFMSRNLASGKRYDFVVRSGGDSRVVTMGPGEQASVSFLKPATTCQRCGQ